MVFAISMALWWAFTQSRFLVQVDAGDGCGRGDVSSAALEFSTKPIHALRLEASSKFF